MISGLEYGILLDNWICFPFIDVEEGVGFMNLGQLIKLERQRQGIKQEALAVWYLRPLLLKPN